MSEIGGVKPCTLVFGGGGAPSFGLGVAGAGAGAGAVSSGGDGGGTQKLPGQLEVELGANLDGSDVRMCG